MELNVQFSRKSKKKNKSHAEMLLVVRCIKLAGISAVLISSFQNDEHDQNAEGEKNRMQSFDIIHKFLIKHQNGCAKEMRENRRLIALQCRALVKFKLQLQENI